MTPTEPTTPTRPSSSPRFARGRGSPRIIVALVLAVSLLAAGYVAAQELVATPAPDPEPDAPRIEIEFTELNDSGIEGIAILYEFGDQTIVEIDVDGAGENHPAHVHAGTCGEVEPQVEYALENVGEDGESRSLIDVSLEELLEGEYVVDLHLAPTELGTLIACADIEGTPEVPEATATPDATEQPTEPATEEPIDIATEVPTVAPTVAPTAAPTEIPTATPTPEPTAVPTETPTAVPTQVPTQEPEPTGVGGIGDGTEGGKGIPLVSGKGESVTTGSAVGGAGDGTNGGVQSGKGGAISPTTGLPPTTGSGSSLLLPESSLGAAIWATAMAAMMLLIAGLLAYRWEAGAHRWRRQGP